MHAMGVVSIIAMTTQAEGPIILQIQGSPQGGDDAWINLFWCSQLNTLDPCPHRKANESGESKVRRYAALWSKNCTQSADWGGCPLAANMGTVRNKCMTSQRHQRLSRSLTHFLPLFHFAIFCSKFVLTLSAKWLQRSQAWPLDKQCLGETSFPHCGFLSGVRKPFSGAAQEAAVSCLIGHL